MPTYYLILLAVTIVVYAAFVRHEWLQFRERRRFRRLVAERVERQTEDVCWTLFRESEARTALALRRVRLGGQ